MRRIGRTDRSAIGAAHSRPAPAEILRRPTRKPADPGQRQRVGGNAIGAVGIEPPELSNPSKTDAAPAGATSTLGTRPSTSPVGGERTFLHLISAPRNLLILLPSNRGAKFLFNTLYT